LERQYCAPVLEAHANVELDERVAFLKNLKVPICSSFSATQLQKIASKLYKWRFDSKHVVVREGEQGFSLFFITSGQCRVVREIVFQSNSGSASRDTTLGPRSRDGNAPAFVRLLSLATLVAGEYFGELAQLHIDVDSPNKNQLQRISPSHRNPRPPVVSVGSARNNNHRYTKNRTTGNSIPSTTFDATVGSINTFLMMDSHDLSEESPSSDGLLGEVDFAKLGEHGPSVHRATVFTDGVVEAYVLPRDAFFATFTHSAVLRMREYAQGYPSEHEIRQHVIRQSQWEDYKDKVVRDAIDRDD
jgi:CRP-like cAMP-binding protein